VSSSGTAAAGLRSQATASGGANQAYLRFARLTAPPLAMFGMAWWEISGASFWRDEAATLSAVRRPLPDVWHFLARTDAVHGLYYLLMFPVVRMLGSSEPDVRLPSALAAAAAAAGVAAIAARLVSEQAGLAAGLMFAVFPVASRYGQQARSYSLVMALAVLASYLLVRALTSVSTGRGRWIAYSVSLAAVGWMNLIGMLIIPAHGVSLYRASRTAAIPDQPGSTGGSKEAVICQRRVIACWLGSAVAAVVLVSPLLVLAWPQRHGTERFLAITSIRAIADVPWRLTGSWEMLPLIAVLAAMTIRPGRARAGLVSLCVPWLAVPPVLLLAAGAVIPVYDSGTFCSAYRRWRCWPAPGWKRSPGTLPTAIG
jgi:mannosyltransferase